MVEAKLGIKAFGMDYVIGLVDSFRALHVLLGPDSSKAIYPSCVAPFAKELATHPITRKLSPEGALYTAFVQGVKFGTFKNPVDNNNDAMWRMYVKMWRLSIDYVRDANANPSDPFCNHLRDDSDFYLPIREQATSRIRSRSSIGPYFSGDNRIRTRSGIYSAIVWRAVTYRSQFSLEHPTMHFQNPEALNSAVETLISCSGGSLTKEHKYFCDKGAYGTPTRRSMDHIDTYWKDLDATKYLELVAVDREPTFADIAQAFDTVVVTTGAQKVTLLPQLGPLGKLNLSGDLVYAGVCPAPSVEEMAQQIVDVNAGSIAGLRLLHYISDSWPSSSETRVACVAQALQSLRDLLDAEFCDADDCSVMALDIISLEHSLCKFARAIKKKLL